jgi:hypothetical protein
LENSSAVAIFVLLAPDCLERNVSKLSDVIEFEFDEIQDMALLSPF